MKINRNLKNEILKEQKRILENIEKSRSQPMAARESLNGKNFEIVIRQVENGFVVTVGYKTFVINSMNELFSGLKLFFTNPDQAADKYCKPIPF